MVGSTCIPYILAIICFKIAGKHYVDYRKCLFYCKSATLDVIKLENYMEMEVIERNTFKVFVSRK